MKRTFRKKYVHLIGSNLMKMKKIFYILPIALLFVACKDDEPVETVEPDVMPAATTVGANTFGCNVDGKLWVAKNADTDSAEVVVDGTYDKGTGDFYLTAVRQDLSHNNFERIKIYGSGIFQTPDLPLTYIMTVEHNKVYGYLDFNPAAGGCGHYYHNPSAPGALTITKVDTIAQIVSGSFQMDLINNDCDPSGISITDGVFDLNY